MCERQKNAVSGPSTRNTSNNSTSTLNSGDQEPVGGDGKHCGDEARRVVVSLNIGCRGVNNPIVDMTFAFIRFMSVGVGVVAVGSIILGGIQYTASSGDPKNTAKAISRISNTVIALLLYFLIFAILSWIVPGGLF